MTFFVFTTTAAGARFVATNLAPLSNNGID